MKKGTLVPINARDKAIDQKHNPDDLYIRATGENRVPKRGDWFISGVVPEGCMAVTDDMSIPFDIGELVQLKIVKVDCPEDHVYSDGWNRDMTSSVVLNKLKEFTITQNPITLKFVLKGWFNKDNFFTFGSDFNSEDEARAFLSRIHASMRRKPKDK